MNSRSGFSEPVEDASRGFIPVAVDTLLPSAVCDFDLFLRHSSAGKLTLYRRRNTPLDKSDLDRLREQGVRTLHVLYDDRDVYAGYLNRLLVEGAELTTTEKYGILKSAARSLLSDSFCGQSLESYVHTIDHFSRQMVESVCNDDLLLREIFFLMAHDYYSYTHVTNVATYSLALRTSGACRTKKS